MGCCEYGVLPSVLLLHAMEDQEGPTRVLGVDEEGPLENGDLHNIVGVLGHLARQH